MSFKDQAVEAARQENEQERQRIVARDEQRKNTVVDSMYTRIEFFGKHYGLEIGDIQVEYIPPGSRSNGYNSHWYPSSAKGTFTADGYPMTATHYLKSDFGEVSDFCVKIDGTSQWIRSLTDFHGAIQSYEAGQSSPADPGPRRRRRGRS